MGLTLVGIVLLLAHALWRAWVYFRFRPILAEEEAGVFAERVLRLYMSGFRVERGWRNGVSYADRVVRLTSPVMRGRSVYHLAIAAHEVGHALQWRGKEAWVRSANGALTAGFGFLVLGFALAPSSLGGGSVLLGYALVASTYPFEADANQEALNVVPPQHREEVRKVLQALSSSYLMVPLGGALVVLGWLGHAS